MFVFPNILLPKSAVFFFATPAVSPFIDGTRRGDRHNVPVTTRKITEDMALHGQMAHQEGIFHALVLAVYVFFFSRAWGCNVATPR